MFSKLLKRFRAAPAPEPASPRPAAAPTLAVIETVDWEQRLEQARGDDAALLALAKEAPAHGLRLAAIHSLRETAALKAALQTFRGHDKTLYRAARAALDMRHRQEETQASAHRLLGEIQALLAEIAKTDAAPLPANRLVELDQAWRKLDTPLIDELPRTEFPRLYAQLQQRSLEHLERQRDEQRRQEEAAAREAAEAKARQAEEEEARQLATAAAAMAQQQQRETHRQTQEELGKRHRQAAEQLQTLEASLAEGRVSDAEKNIPALKAEIHTLNNPGLQTRLQTALAEVQRLKSWQNWGGLQAREALLQEAEILANAATAARQTMATKQHARAIEHLRSQWKKLDQLGSPPNPALWQRFDAALQTAWQPVALQKKILGDAREENLQARLALLASLDSFPLPETAIAETGSAPADWISLLHTLSEFRTAWRKLGPLEHTVPHAGRAALQSRLADALSRLETPLDAARQDARRARLNLIEQARALLPLAQQRDIVHRVRELQNQWQQQARTNALPPLPHKEEITLRDAFRAASDAIFAQRKTAHEAHLAEQHEHQATREALIAELEALLESPEPEKIPRILNTLDARWRAAPALPGHLAARLDTAWRNAHQRIHQHRCKLQENLWQTACDDLLIRLECCEALEDGQQTQADRQTALPSSGENLPTPWLQAIRQRHADAIAGRLTQTPDESACDQTLLQLEATLDIPSPPDYQAARQQLRLQTMKLAMERRHTAQNDPISLVTGLLRHPGHTPLQRERLRRALSAMRRLPAPLPHSA